MVTVETVAINSHSVCTFAFAVPPQLAAVTFVDAANVAGSAVDVKNMDSVVVDVVVVVSIVFGVFQDNNRPGREGLRPSHSCRRFLLPDDLLLALA